MEAAPEAGQQQGAAVGPGDQEGLLEARLWLPGVDAAGRNQAAPCLEGLPEHRALLQGLGPGAVGRMVEHLEPGGRQPPEQVAEPRDRKSTRLNSSHVRISYAVFCLKKKKTE